MLAFVHYESWYIDQNKYIMIKTNTINTFFLGCEPPWQPKEQKTLAAEQPAAAENVSELLQLARLTWWRTGLRAHGAHITAPRVSPGNSSVAWCMLSEK